MLLFSIQSHAFLSCNDPYTHTTKPHFQPLRLISSQVPNLYTCSFTLLCCGVWFVGGRIDYGVLVSPGLLHPEQQDIRFLHPCHQGQSEFLPSTPSDLTHKHINPPSLCIDRIHHPLYIHPGHTIALLFIPFNTI